MTNTDQTETDPMTNTDQTETDPRTLYARIAGMAIAPMTTSEAEQWCASRFISASEGARIWRNAYGDEMRADVIWQDEDWWTDRLCQQGAR